MLEVLLVEDSLGDVRLMREALRDANPAARLHVVTDGAEAVAFLIQPTVILTTSEDDADIRRSYQLQANCYLTKPVQLDAFESLVRNINEFWLKRARLPTRMGISPMTGGAQHRPPG